jgi:hypothetical protein
MGVFVVDGFILQGIEFYSFGGYGPTHAISIWH